MSTPDDMTEFSTELRQVEHRVFHRIDPGRSALIIAGALVALLISGVLPWVGSTPGWRIFVGATEPELKIGVLPQVFAVMAVVFGVAVTALTLSLRRWPLAWLATLGCWLSVLLGFLSIWTRQTAQAAPGPNIGLVLAVLALAVLGAQWFRLAWSRP